MNYLLTHFRTAFLTCLVAFGLFATGSASAQDAIVIGQSAPLSGPNQALGEEIRNGANAYFKKINEAGGVNGRKVELISLDDANNADKAGDNTKKLLDDSKVIALFGYGSATLSRLAIPQAEKANAAFVSPFTGADGMRKFNRVVYNHRASYADELEKIVNHYTTVGVKNFGILYYDDAVGKENDAAVERALAQRGLKPSVLVAMNRAKPDIAAAVAKTNAAKPDVMIVTTLYPASAQFIIATKRANAGMQFASTSFAGPNLLLNALGKDGVGVAIAQVTPAVTNRTVPVVVEYQQAMERHTGKKEFGATSLEAYIAAKVLVEGLRKAGPKVARETLLTALDSLGTYDAGGFRVTYAPMNHNGSSFAEMTVISKALTFAY